MVSVDVSDWHNVTECQLIVDHVSALSKVKYKQTGDVIKFAHNLFPMLVYHYIQS